MSLDVLLSTILLVSFLVTIVLAILSYVAYKLRESRRTGGGAAHQATPALFERVLDVDEPEASSRESPRAR
jgi:heme/copper-type cytochrome/quinol oxidase subunit 2